MNNNNKIIPIVTYNNIIKDKYKIYRDNNKKSVIYRWVKNINNKSYVGSAKCLKSRLSVYYSINGMNNRLKRGRSAIYSALLKYGYYNFKLEILEYCEQNILISREQFYLDLLKPEYNICKIAGSTFGKVHSISTREKIANSVKGKNHPLYGKHHTFETRKALSAKLLNRVHIMPKMRLETKLKLSLVSIGVNVKVFDLQDNLIKEFSSINSTAKYYDVASSTINTAIKKGRPYHNLIFKSEVKDNRV
jgi:group I intron endonuclease